MNILTSNILKCEQGIDFPQDFSSELAKDFIRKILRKKPSDRPKMHEIKNHSFIYEVKIKQRNSQIKIKSVNQKFLMNKSMNQFLKFNKALLIYLKILSSKKIKMKF